MPGPGARGRRGRQALLAAALLALPATALAAPPLDQGVMQLASTMDGQQVSAAVRLVMLLTALAFLPAIVLVMTPFTRFVIVFSLLRQALGLQQSPPNQVLVGLSLFLSMLVMRPTLGQVRHDALDPYMAGQVETGEAIEKAMAPMRHFMLANVRKDDLRTTLRIARLPRPASIAEVPSSAIVSAYVLSELKTAFIIAVKVYIPFLVIDIVVASVLLGMGMMVLPPVVISLPFKLLLFVLMDGWGLLVSSMVGSFH